MLERQHLSANTASVANKWESLEQVSLSGHGKGKAIISYTIATGENAKTIYGYSILLIQDCELNP